MRMLNESTENYVTYHRDRVIAEKSNLDSLKLSFSIHKEKNCKFGAKCTICDLYIEAIMNTEQELDQFNLNYSRAVRGIDE